MFPYPSIFHSAARSRSHDVQVERSGVWYVPIERDGVRASASLPLRTLGASVLDAMVRLGSPRRALTTGWRRHARASH